MRAWGPEGVRGVGLRLPCWDSTSGDSPLTLGFLSEALTLQWTEGRILGVPLDLGYLLSLLLPAIRYCMG